MYELHPPGAGARAARRAAPPGRVGVQLQAAVQQAAGKRMPPAGRKRKRRGSRGIVVEEECGATADTQPPQQQQGRRPATRRASSPAPPGAAAPTAPAAVAQPPPPANAERRPAELPADFAEYYRAQAVVPAGEWAAFAASLSSELSCSFRLTPGPAAAGLQHTLGAPGGLAAHAVAGADEAPPRVETVPWLPAGSAYVVRLPMGGGRQGLRRRCPRFHGWLTAEHEAGRLTRQELVSMIPPLLLAAEPGEVTRRIPHPPVFAALSLCLLCFLLPRSLFNLPSCLLPYPHSARLGRVRLRAAPMLLLTTAFKLVADRARHVCLAGFQDRPATARRPGPGRRLRRVSPGASRAASATLAHPP